jgi:hypothetical protein
VFGIFLFLFTSTFFPTSGVFLLSKSKFHKMLADIAHAAQQLNTTQRHHSSQLYPFSRSRSVIQERDTPIATILRAICTKDNAQAIICVLMMGTSFLRFGASFRITGWGVIVANTVEADYLIFQLTQGKHFIYKSGI